MEVGEEFYAVRSITKSTAVIGCVAMTLLYVAILYAPTLIFRFPPPTSYNQFMIRRFICAAASSLLCVFISSFLLLPVQSWKITYLLNVYGIQADHVWHAVVFPFSLTSLMYAGSLILKFLLLLDSWIGDGSEGSPLSCFHSVFHKIYYGVMSVASNIGAWRNLVVAPITEELVFRACMIPLLLCGGFKVDAVLLLCPIFFSLAHLNHLLEFYFRKNCSLQKTFMAVGTQLAYTMIFGSYASFLFIRTGHLIAPLVAHIVCNYMGLPAVYAKRKGVVVTLAFTAGIVALVRLLFPLTSPALYNFRIDNCHCWHGYCSWS